jgi:hypothetical protein
MRSCFPQTWTGTSGDSGRPFDGSSEAGERKNQSSYSGSYLSHSILLSQRADIRSCQCGVSRSATLAIAYVMALAASGALPSHLGHIRGMQDAYDFVKSKSPWIGPNVSLVFQLVEFARNLTTLITIHLETPGGAEGQDVFPHCCRGGRERGRVGEEAEGVR